MPGKMMYMTILNRQNLITHWVLRDLHIKYLFLSYISLTIPILLKMRLRKALRCCYRTQVWLLAAQKANNWEAGVDRKESCFNQKSRQSGEKVDSCPKTNSKDSAQPWQFLKGKKREESQWIIEAGGWILYPSPLCADWLTLSSDIILPVWSACRIAKGPAGVRELVIL